MARRSNTINSYVTEITVEQKIAPGEKCRVTNNLTPLTDNTENLGSATQRWADAHLADVNTDSITPPSGTLIVNGALSPVGAFDPVSITTNKVNTTTQQIGPMFYVGTTSGLMTTPSVAPTAAKESSGTGLSGNYFTVITYGNDNGETTVSPQTTTNVGSGEFLRVNSADGDYLTGASWMRVYMSQVSGGPYHLQTPISHTVSVATVAVTGKTISSATRSKGIVTASCTGHGFSAGWPVLITLFAGDTTLNGAVVVKKSVDANTFEYFSPGADGTDAGGGQADAFPILRQSNKIYIRTQTSHTCAMLDKVVVAGVADTGFNGTFRVWEVPSSSLQAGNFAIVINQTGSPANSTGGTVALLTGIGDGTQLYPYGIAYRFDTYNPGGAAPPSSNTAAIDPLQVAYNAARLATDTLQKAGTRRGKVVLKNPTSLFAVPHVMTTPFIMGNHGPLLEGSGIFDGDIFTSGMSLSSASSCEKGVIMIYGGAVAMKGVTIQASTDTNAVMVVGRASQIISEDFVWKCTASSTQAACLRFFGADEGHNLTFRNFTMWGGRSGILGTHSGLFRTNYKQFRINCGTGESASALIWDAGHTDFGRNAAGSVTATYSAIFKQGDTEVNIGPAFDVKDGLLTLDSVDNADTNCPAGSVAAAIRWRTNALTSNGNYNGLTVKGNSSLFGDTDAWTTVFIDTSNPLQGVHFNGCRLGGSGTASNGIDFQKIRTNYMTCVGSNFDFTDESGAAGRVINLSATVQNLFVMGCTQDPTGTSNATNWITGKTRICEAGNLANQKTLQISSNVLEWLAADGITVLSALENTGNSLVKRLKASKGTALVAGDFVLHANWGVGAAISAVTGTDQGWNITVTAAGTPGASPTVVLTYKDGTWTSAPVVISKMVGGTGTITDLSDSTTATVWTITFNGTPVAGSNYLISGIAMGR